MNPFTPQLLQKPEGKTLEFKRDLSSPKPLLKTLVAFANSAGGFLVLGVTNDRQNVGIEQPLDEEERLCNLIADAIAPRLVPNIELLTIEGKTLLVVEVYPSGQRPHWLKAEGPDNGVFVRLGSTNRQADRELVAELRRSVEGTGFDEMPMPDLSVEDLDIAAAQQLFGTSRTLDEKTLLTLKLLSPHQGKLVPTKGAVLLFGKERLRHFPDAWIQCGRFFGTEKLDIFDHIELDQPLPKAVDEVMLFLKKHAMRGADLSEVRRKDVWSIPLSILREVVINALVHADYSQRGAPVRVVFLDDRIEIENPGLLLPGMTIEDMKQGASKIRNTVIARVFRELHLIEQWGTGVRRIFTEAQELGLPEPQIKEIGMRVRFIVPLLEPIRLRKETQPAGEQVSEQVSEQVLSMLQACRVRERSKQELLEVAGLANVYLNYKRHIAPLLEQNLLAMTIPDKPQSRLQKYRLTDQGRELLNQANQ
ncbi:putative DNA binding domain-containing protein [Acidithiobacillus sp. MC6.1]|nr:putative DNA binding domain-containing protein [Acidithiobacillus sp. MC6.1]